MHAPADEGEIEHEATQDEQHRVQVLNLWFVDDRTDDKVRRNHKNENWNDNRHLVWTRVVGLCVSHYDEGQHGATVEDPRCEAEEINQRVDGSVKDHRAGNQWMENQSGGWCQATDVDVR